MCHPDRGVKASRLETTPCTPISDRLRNPPEPFGTPDNKANEVNYSLISRRAWNGAPFFARVPIVFTGPQPR